ncbi:MULTISPECIES: DUF7695 domain-containing protein [Pedobacter]
MVNLKANQAMCNNCGNTLTSHSQYDLQVCQCGFIAVDDGLNLRIIELTIPSVITNSLSSCDKSNFTIMF